MRSMTGFGRGEAATDEWKIEIELSGVNRKQLDIGINLPSTLSELEGEAKRLISEAISRGRIGGKVTLSHTGGTSSHLVFDESLAQQYIAAAKTLSEKGGIETRLTAADLFRAPGLFKIEECNASADDLRDPLLAALNEAVAQLTSMQESEGEHLRSDLLARLDAIMGEVDVIRELALGVPVSHREHLRKRLQESGLEIDLNDDRILREIGLYAERCDITEELTRIDSHAVQFRSYLESNEPVGRPLDFLCQEFNRELNTIGSKANHADIAQRIVNSKTELEKIREQVQNVQ
ncbi:MAG: YicC family protein [Verrucomicrobiales bacterium]|nr:YicC family protein [Verrucomicrobiales bacterium]